MTDQIRIGIVGYGNLGRGVELALRQCPDMALAGVFTRRDPAFLSILTPDVPVRPVAELSDELDVLILCGGSAADLPIQSPQLARRYHIVDSFDTHARIPAHFAAVDAAARAGGKLALISAGWDPGLFSWVRALAGSVLPSGESHTFWGPGVSQGHSDAIRRIPGVLDARAYTIPMRHALDQARSGLHTTLTAQERHTRVCYVAAEPGADPERIQQEIVTMPHYFAGYQTQVHFVSREELDREHNGLPHGGTVLHSGQVGGHRAALEFKLELASNPAFTGAVLTACARAVYRLSQAGETGCRTVLDIPISALSPLPPDVLRRTLL